MVKKYFTVEEANACIPALEQEIIALQELQQTYKHKKSQLHELKEQIGQSASVKAKDPFFTMEADLEFLQIQVKQHMQNIDRMGAFLKDIDIGLVDFPSLHNGQEIELCWKQGEKEIMYYHGVNEGYIFRKKLK